MLNAQCFTQDADDDVRISDNERSEKRKTPVTQKEHTISVQKAGYLIIT